MTKPTIRELISIIQGGHSGNEQCRILLAERVEAVLKLHGAPTPSEAKNSDLCLACGELWPCPTYRAMDGEQP